MRRKTAVVVIFVLIFAATCLAKFNLLSRWAGVVDLNGPSRPTVESSERGDVASTNTKPFEPPASVPSKTKPPPAETGQSETGKSVVKPGLDIARISRNGSSVFAGKAAPLARIAVMDGDKEVATATANESGDWSVVTDYQFASANPDIKLKTLEAEAMPAPAPANPSAAPATNPPASPAAPTSPSVAMMKSFEAVVATAREEAKSGAAAHIVTNPAPAPTVTPVPMTFVYNEDVLTPDGHRSTELLLEYLKLKHFASVTLTGHADERGTADYNMDLSRRRLETILRRLRDGGYEGKLNLVPKGSSEPFKGVDRAQIAKEDLMQLDRRVELRGAE